MTTIPPMISTPQVRKARFSVTFPDEDESVHHYCTSVNSLTKILKDHNRSITKWQLYSIISPNDRRYPCRNKSKALLLGADIKRLAHLAAPTTPPPPSP
jgi:hypothetical protein